MGDAQPETRNELLDSLLGDFLDESEQLLTQLNKNLLQLDDWVQALGADHRQRCDEALLNEMFRAAHSLKGLSAMLGLSDINNLTHKIENVFDAARHDQLTITGDVTELMFIGLDQLTALVGLLKAPEGEPVDCDALLDAIARVLQAAGAEKKQATQADAEFALVSPGGDAAETPADAIAENGDTPDLCEASGERAPAEGWSRQMGPVPFFPGTDDAGAPQVDPLDGIKDEVEIPDNYLSMFVDEADTSLDALTSGLLALEDGAAGELRNLLGTAHKIKGSAASIGLNRAAKLAHLMEDLLEKAVASGSTVSPPTTEVLLKCVDGLRRHLADLRSGGRVSDYLGPLARRLLAAQSDPPAENAGDGSQSPCQRRDDREIGDAAGRATYLGDVTFDRDLPTAGLKAQLIYEKLLKLGDVCDCQPPPDRLDGAERLECFRFRVTTAQSAEAVAAQLRVAGVLEVKVTPWAAEPAKAEPSAAKSEGPPSSPRAQRRPPEAGQRAAASPRPAETVRVDTDRLDQLMDLAGQLVINRAQFSQIGERLKAAVDCNQTVRAVDSLSAELDKLDSHGLLRVDDRHDSAEWESVRGQIRRVRSDLDAFRQEVQTMRHARDSVRELFEAIHQLERVSDGIQKGVMDIRMVPIGPLFARFHRVVRDISRAGGKEVRLEIAGEKTELDKRMIDELGDPLVHLVRNSADHGIESPEERRAAGKPGHGTVTLDAFHRGNSIVIEVRDDGRGLDADRILRKALQSGLVSEADAQRLTTQQIHQLIWKPGLSTAEKVTDVSGRGMGMDIVKTKIEELSGVVDIHSAQGKGTTITIKLPLTLAILPSLMVEIAKDVFAMPMEAVTEIVSVGRNHVRTVHGQPMATVRGRVISLVRLRSVLRFRGAADADVDPSAETTLVVVSDAGREVGLAVDRVIGEQDVVIKSIAENYKNVPGVAGASILGDGRVALILDIPALIAELAKRAAHATC